MEPFPRLGAWPPSGFLPVVNKVCSAKFMMLSFDWVCWVQVSNDSHTWKLYITARFSSTKALSFHNDALLLVFSSIFSAIVWRVEKINIHTHVLLKRGESWVTNALPKIVILSTKGEITHRQHIISEGISQVACSNLCYHVPRKK